MLIDVFTKAELLAAAKAADSFPPGHDGWGVDEEGREVAWPCLSDARFLCPAATIAKLRGITDVNTAYNLFVSFEVNYPGFVNELELAPALVAQKLREAAGE